MEPVFSNIDSGGDIIEPGAFTKTIAEGIGRVKILSGHNDSLLPIGIPNELREDAKGLFMSAKISDTTLGRDVKTLIHDGVLCELSIGYDPVVFDYDETAPPPPRSQTLGNQRCHMGHERTGSHYGPQIG